MTATSRKKYSNQLNLLHLHSVAFPTEYSTTGTSQYWLKRQCTMLSVSQLYYMSAKVRLHVVTTSKPWSLFTSQVCKAFLDFAGGTKSLTLEFGAERALTLSNRCLCNNFVGLDTWSACHPTVFLAVSCVESYSPSAIILVGRRNVSVKTWS